MYLLTLKIMGKVNTKQVSIILPKIRVECSICHMFDCISPRMKVHKKG